MSLNGRCATHPVHCVRSTVDGCSSGPWSPPWPGTVFIRIRGCSVDQRTAGHGRWLFHGEQFEQGGGDVPQSPSLAKGAPAVALPDQMKGHVEVGVRGVRAVPLIL